MNQKKNISFTIKVCFTHTYTLTRTQGAPWCLSSSHLSMIYNIFITPDNFLAPLSVFASHSSTHQDRSVDLHLDTQSHCIYSFVPGILVVCCLFLLQTGHPLFTCSRLSCQFRAQSSMGRESSPLSAFAVVKIGYSRSFRSDRDEKRAKTMGRK